MEDNKSVLSDFEHPQIEVSKSVRIIAGIVDWIIEILLIIAITLIINETLPALFQLNSYALYILLVIVMFVYRLISILIFGRTIGMMAFKAKYLTSNFDPLSGKEKLMAALLIRNSNIKIYK